MWIETLGGWFKQLFLLDPALRQRLLISATVLVVAGLCRWLIVKVLERRIEDVRIRYRWQKTSQYTLFTIVIFLLGRLWFEGFQSLATYLGLLSAGLAIALKELVANLVGWAFILWRRPFEVGDRIQIGEVAGDVIDFRIFQFTLLEIGNWVDADQSTGRVIHVNNGKIFTEHLANYSKGFAHIWNEVAVLVTFESDWRKAKAMLVRIASRYGEKLGADAETKLREAARKYMIFYSKLTPTVYTSVRDCGVLLTLRYLCDPRKRRTTEEKIWEDVLDLFAEADDIDFAYPTQRFYNNMTEGKPGARSSGS